MENALIWCGAIMTFCGTFTTLLQVVKILRSPKENLDARLKKIEDKLAKHDDMLGKDKTRLDSLDEGNRVTQKALLALLSHGIDGNNIADMKSARDELQKFLINR